MRSIWLVLLIVSFAFSRTSYADCDNGKVKVAGHADYPPISWKENGLLKGVGFDTMSKILTKFDMQLESTQPYPWKRALKMTERGDIDALVGVTYSKEREKYFLFLPKPLINSSFYVIYLKNNPISKLESVTGGTTHRTRFSDQFQYYVENNLIIEKVATIEQNVLKLKSGRVQYLILALMPTIHFIQENNIDIDIEYMPDAIDVREERIAIAKSSSCAKYLNKFNDALIELHKKDYIWDRFNEHTKDWKVID